MASIKAYRNCLNQFYFTLKGRGIGYSFQLAITAPSLFDHWLLYRHCAKLVNTREILNGEPISFPREYFYQTKRISSDSCNLWRLTRIQRVENEQKTRSLTFFKRQNLPFCITQTLEISFCSGLLSITWNEFLNMTGIKTDVRPPRIILTWHRGQP